MACFILRSTLRGLQIIRRENPDLIHAHFAVPAGAAAWALSRLTGKPYFITAHGGDVPGGAPQKTDRWFRCVLPFTKPFWKDAAAIVSVSEQTRRFALQHYAVDIQIIPQRHRHASLPTRNFQPSKTTPHPLSGTFLARKERHCGSGNPGAHP